jgi:GntR family transcriptional regulator/MocR family aminotransferase
VAAHVDRASGNMSRQLVTALREAVSKGVLQAGDALPSTRTLAETLQIGRGTVVEAYEQLTAEGVLDPIGRAGTRVAQALAPVAAKGAAHRKRQPKANPDIPERASAFAQIASEFRPMPPVPFAISVPIGTTAPGDIWRRLGNRLRARGPGAPAGYADPLGARCRCDRRSPITCASLAQCNAMLNRSL